MCVFLKPFFFKNPPVEGTVNSMEQNNRFFFILMSKDSISDQTTSPQASVPQLIERRLIESVLDLYLYPHWFYPDPVCTTM